MDAHIDAASGCICNGCVDAIRGCAPPSGWWSAHRPRRARALPAASQPRISSPALEVSGVKPWGKVQGSGLPVGEEGGRGEEEEGPISEKRPALSRLTLNALRSRGLWVGVGC